MTFKNTAVDVPDELIFAHAEGRVVFFCGAGISYDAGIPVFKGLFQNVLNDLARLSTFASKTPAVAGFLLLGLHYTVVFAASAASLEIFGGGWAGNVSPSRSSRTARSGFGST